MPDNNNDTSQAQSLEPTDSANQLGLRLKMRRHLKGMTLAELAKETGLSVGSLSQVERGLVSPTVRTIYSVATALGVSPAWFVDPDSVRDWNKDDDYIVRATRRTKIFSGNGVVKHLGTPEKQSRYRAFIVTIRPGGGSGDDQYTHVGEEMGIVLGGSLILEIEQRTYLLNQGDCFAFPSSLMHRFYNDSSVDTTVFWVNSLE